MAHAPVPVLAAADHVTDAIDQDGAAAALRSLLPADRQGLPRGVASSVR